MTSSSSDPLTTPAKTTPRQSSLLSKLKVSQRIQLGFTWVLGITFLGTGIGILTGNHYYKKALNIQEQVDREIQLLSQLQAGVLQSRTHQQQLIPLSEFPEDFTDEYSHILVHAQTIREIKQSLQDPENGYKDLEDFLQTYDGVPAAYLAELDRLVSSLDIDNITTPEELEEAQRALLTFTNSDLAITFDGISDDLSGIIKDAYTRLSQAVADTESASHRRNLMIIISMLLSAASATLLAIAINRSISQPLKAVEETALEISKNGNFNLRAEVMSKDEVGTVATAFNLLLERVNKLLSDQRIRNEQLENINEKLIATQDQMVAQEKLASLGSLTAGIAHEIKNPLNFVNNFSELSVELTEELIEELEENKDSLDATLLEDLTEIITLIQTNVGKIEHHGKRADKIVANMLKHSSNTDGEWSVVDINDLIAEAVNLAYHGMRAKHSDFNLTIDTDYDETVGAIKVCPQDLNRVFLNIASNACYAIYQRQQAENNDFEPLLKIRTRKQADKVVITIRDNGPGMSLEVQKKVFNQFFTTKPSGEGTGLGLSLSYNIVVEQHQGNIEVMSEEGIYTDFIVTLPA